MITSTANTKVKRLVNLNKKHKLRTEEKIFVTEGIRMFREVPKDRITEVYVSESFWKKEGQTVRQVLEGTGIEPEILADRVYDHVSDTRTPQGILCLVRQKDHDITGMLQDECPLLLVLDNLQDPGNL